MLGFGKKNLVDVIRKGNLEDLKKFIAKNPGCLDQWYEWEIKNDGSRSGQALHIAACFFSQNRSSFGEKHGPI